MPSADRPFTARVAGGSIGGLGAGVALHAAGVDVHVHERRAGPMETRGAGIVVQPELMQLLREGGAAELPTTACSVRRYLDPVGGDGRVQRAPQSFTSWEAIYRTLRAALPADRYHTGSAVPDGSTPAVDLLVHADGGQSAARRRLLPDVEPRYAGYVAWRGVLDEAHAPPGLASRFDDAFTFSDARAGGHILAYLIPGAGADATPGKRRLNWVWYVRADDAERARLLVDRDGRHHRASLQPGEAPSGIVAEIAGLAKAEVHPMMAELVAATPDPFVQTIADVTVPRMVFGREVLLGDAAFVVRPHTAGATAKAARDALVLAAALKRARQDIDAALDAFEQAQLEYGRQMSDHGVALGRRWAA